MPYDPARFPWRAEERAVLVQLTAVPDGNDPQIGVMSTPELARAAADGHNLWLDRGGE